MGSRKEQLKVIERFVETTHFEHEEVEKMISFFHTVTDTTKIDRNAFREILHKYFNLTETMMMDRVYRAFAVAGEGGVTESDFVHGMSAVLRGSIEEKVDFVFRVYATITDDSSRVINRDTMFFLLKHTMVKIQNEEERDEGIKDLVELVMKKMDVDHDGKLSLADYTESVTKDPLLMEALGPCLPDEKHASEFMRVVMSTP
eukprot:m.108224 g.108224  ORF g.108224 m.108224 type:complete len:202 (-) comp12703_c2_seq1:580-1185(-)